MKRSQVSGSDPSPSVQNATARFDGLQGHLVLTLRAGECRLNHPAGIVEIDATNTDLRIDHPTGSTHVSASGGRLTILDPALDLGVEARRSEVDVTLAVPVPATILTTDEPLRLRLAGPPRIALTAIASEGGAIHAEDFGLQAEVREQGQELTHVFGADGSRVELRNQRGDIVIVKTK